MRKPAHRLLALLALAFAATAATPVVATEPDEVLADAALEERARALGRQLRCVMCQSQSIEDSNAPIARDMRLAVRERLLAGDTDPEVREFLVARYGDYVLLKPPLKASTLLLWAAPPLLLLIALGAVGLHLHALSRKGAGQGDNGPA
jgi:cytochrome c-type biogenesis protein CcmH